MKLDLHHGIVRNRFYSKIVDAFFSESNCILDLGCGLGHFLNAAKKKKKKSIGIDINTGSLSACKNAGLAVVRCDLFALPLKSGAFDGVFFSHVIEHISADQIHKLISEVNRVLNGKLVVVTPTEHSKFWTEGHVVAYSKNSLEQLLQKEGYIVSKVIYDKCFMLGVNDRKIWLNFFNKLPLLWLKMNIIAAASTPAKPLNEPLCLKIPAK